MGAVTRQAGGLGCDVVHAGDHERVASVVAAALACLDAAASGWAACDRRSPTGAAGHSCSVPSGTVPGDSAEEVADGQQGAVQFEVPLRGCSVRGPVGRSRTRSDAVAGDRT
ncbi:hypothetical protein [Streptomyces sp. NPDC005303]|uniref:hypothetical protein n=1 Tax=Streptomyces sp. NPDC005303 TaxID=3155713 RepID=UPI0033A7CBB5